MGNGCRKTNKTIFRKNIKCVSHLEPGKTHEQMENTSSWINKMIKNTASSLGAKLEHNSKRMAENVSEKIL